MPPGLAPHVRAEGVVDAQPGAVPHPAAEVAVDRLPGREPPSGSDRHAQPERVTYRMASNTFRNGTVRGGGRPPGRPSGNKARMISQRRSFRSVG